MFIRLYFLTVLVLTLLQCKHNETSMAKESTNPFLSDYTTPFEVPPFDLIKDEHYAPAILKGIDEQKAQFDSIANTKAEASFDNTILALATSGETLGRTLAVFYNMSGANTNDTIDKISEEMAPVLSKHEDYLYLNDAIFARVKKLWDTKETLALNKQQNALLEKYYKAFIRNGALLEPDAKRSLSAINEELALLTIKFGQNILAETNNFKLIIEDSTELKGLPQDLIYEASAKAKSAGMDGKWVFTLHNPSVMPFLQYAENRTLREKIWKAMSNKGNNGNANDNNDVIKKIVRLRAEKARLLGYGTHADYVLEEQMAKNPSNVYKLLNDLWKPALRVAQKERDEMSPLLQADGQKGPFKPFDWRYYAEKIKKTKYAFDEQEMKPYFSLDNTRDGIFALCDSLYGLKFVKRTDLPIYHPEVSTYEVKEADGSTVGILYMDFHPRESKRSGAWMTSFKEQTTKDGKRVPPVISIVCNFSKPTQDTPALLTFDEVTTFFHEFGHALHGLLSNVDYQQLAGTNVQTDFVELPSQIMENWAAEPSVLAFYAKHFKTGAPLPNDLLVKLKESNAYGQGFATVEYLAASMLDMDYHTVKNAFEGDVAQFEKKAMHNLGLMDEIIPRYRSTYFNHIFSGGYSSGYYSYIWSEVLDSDAFSVFKQKGLFNKELANSFRTNILEKGGTEDPMTLYKTFRGQEPSIQPLLQKRHLVN